VDRTPEELAPALAAIDAGDVESILTPSAGFAELARLEGYRVIEVNAGMERLYEIRAARSADRPGRGSSTPGR
jgi:hypothetical protein